MKNTKSSDYVKKIVISAMFAAMTTLLTLFPHFSFGVGGYVHLGDAVIYLCASMIPTGYAVSAAAIGGGLADLISFPLYTVPTLLIKACIALCFSSRNGKIVNKRNIAALPFAAVITVGGYYLAEGILYGNWISPVYSIPFNLMQAAASCMVYVAVGLALDKAKVKQMIKMAK